MDGKNLADGKKILASMEMWRLRKSGWPAEELPYCLGSAESATADFSLDPLMSTFSSLLMMNCVHVFSK
jgi:hypothetical protein